jgi:hypothetical protein
VIHQSIKEGKNKEPIPKKSLCITTSAPTTIVVVTDTTHNKKTLNGTPYPNQNELTYNNARSQAQNIETTQT